MKTVTLRFANDDPGNVWIEPLDPAQGELVGKAISKVFNVHGRTGFGLDNAHAGFYVRELLRLGYRVEFLPRCATTAEATTGPVPDPRAAFDNLCAVEAEAGAIESRRAAARAAFHVALIRAGLFDAVTGTPV